MSCKKAQETETILKLIQVKLEKYTNFEDLLATLCFKTEDEEDEKIIDLSTRGFYYERLWDLCIKFGLTDLTLKPTSVDYTTHFDENSNSKKITFDRKFWNNIKNAKGGRGFLQGYLMDSVRSGNTGGFSDITFLNTSNNMENLYLISVKYFNEEKGITKYDVGNLCALIEFHKKKIEKYTYICL